MFIIFASSLKERNMKRKTKARIKLEQELLFYLQLYGELRGRNETWKMLKVIEERIDELVEILKN